jgi:glutamate/tyrosine decarboxylase-like PLP-dependent enzyme
MQADEEMPGPPAALFPPRAVRAAIDERLTRQLADAGERVLQGPVVPDIDMTRFRAELAGFDFADQRPLPDLLDWTVAQLEHGLVHVNHRRYFGLFNPAASFPAQCADRVVGAFNPQLATWTTSPVAVELENHVIAAVARRAGLPATARGQFTSGGSEANYSAVLCALTRANARFAADGARAYSGAPVMYTSAESHLAWLKIVHQAGIGRNACRLVPTDGTGRMDVAALRRQLAQDRAAGCVPFLLVATAGTTNAGMVDPLRECARIARDEGLWLHVDAAWGGAILASERLAPALDGTCLADSVTIDAHKWFATTMGCGMYITRHPEVLSATFQVSTAFMPSNHADLDPYVTSFQWSRRFLGLRLFLALGAAGWPGYATHVERAVALVAGLRGELSRRGWRIANDSPLAVLCVEPPAASCDVPTLAARVLAGGRAWVAAANYEGRKVLRICLTHGEADGGDMRVLADALEAARLPAA